MSLRSPAVAIIVGLHFIPLALKLPMRAYLATAAAFIAIGLICTVVPSPVRLLVVGLAAATVLWITTLVFVGVPA